MSNIDPTKPTQGQATTQSVRDNFSAAATEIDANAAAIVVNAAAIADGAFTKYLDGYDATGLHTVYTGDLNDVLWNSDYLVQDVSITNGPADFTSTGFLLTDIANANPNRGNQTLQGMATGALYTQWNRARVGSVWDAWKRVIDGNLLVLPLPTSDPLVSGALWNDGGTVKVSA